MCNTQAIYCLLPILDDDRYGGLYLDDRRVSSYALSKAHFDMELEDPNWKAPRLSVQWVAPRVKLERGKIFNDYPCIDLYFPAFSSRAVEALRDLLEPRGEFLPVICKAGTYWAYNPTTVLDALDIDASYIDWQRRNKLTKTRPVLASRIDHYVFRPDAIVGQTIFRLIQMPTETYVTHDVVTRVEEFKLQGFNFQKVWPIDPPWKRGSIAEMERRAGL